MAVTVTQRFLTESHASVIRDKLSELTEKVEKEYATKDELKEFKDDASLTYSTKEELEHTKREFEYEYMKKVSNELWVEYKIVKMPEYNTVQISKVNALNSKPLEGNAIKGYGLAWMTAEMLMSIYLNGYNDSTTNDDNVCFLVKYKSLDEVINELTLYKTLFKWHASYVYNSYLYDKQLSSKCFGTLDSHKKDIKAIRKERKSRLSFYYDQNYKI